MEKEFNYGDGVKFEVVRIAKEKGLTLNADQIDDVAYEICHDDDINNLLDSRIKAVFKEIIE